MPFIRHKQRAITSLSPVKGQGRWINPSKGGRGVFIDPTADPGGNGSIGQPYDTFAPINADPTSFNNQTIFIKAGTTIYDELIISSTTGITVTRYGAGANPIIDGSEPYTTGTWTLGVADTYTNDTEAGTQNLLINGIHIRIVPNSASIAPQFGITDDAGYVAGTLTVLVTGGDPRTDPVRNAVRPSAITFSASNNLAITDIDTQMCRIAGLQSKPVGSLAAHNVSIDGGTHRWNGGTLGAIGDSILFNGFASDRGTGNSLRNATLDGNNISPNPANGIEVNFQNGFIMEDCTLTDYNGNGVELFTETNNSLFDRIKAFPYPAVGRAVRLYSETSNLGTGVADHTDNLFRCFAHQNSLNYIDSGSQAGVNGGFMCEAGTGTVFINISLHGDNGNQFEIREVGTTALLYNCIVAQTHVTGNNSDGLWVVAQTSLAVSGTDFNDWWTYALPTGRVWRDNITTYSLNLIANWRATAGTPDVNSINTGDPLYTSVVPSAPDLSLQPGTSAAQIGDASRPDTPTVDIDGNPYTINGTDIDAGAYNFSS